MTKTTKENIAVLCMMTVIVLAGFVLAWAIRGEEIKIPAKEITAEYTTGNPGIIITGALTTDPYLTMGPNDKVSIQATPFFNLEFVPEKGELILRQQGHKTCVFKAYEMVAESTRTPEESFCPSSIKRGAK